MTITLTTEQLREQMLGHPEIGTTIRITDGGEVRLYIMCSIFAPPEEDTDGEHELYLHRDGSWRDSMYSGPTPEQTALLFHTRDETERRLSEINTALASPHLPPRSL